MPVVVVRGQAAQDATIDAARAAEAGKGFAVVDGEVKDLARETAKATEDITRRVEAVQADTDGAVTAITEITAVIGSINDYQTTIAAAVGKLNRLWLRTGRRAVNRRGLTGPSSRPWNAHRRPAHAK